MSRCIYILLHKIKSNGCAAHTHIMHSLTPSARSENREAVDRDMHINLSVMCPLSHTRTRIGKNRGEEKRERKVKVPWSGNTKNTTKNQQKRREKTIKWRFRRLRWVRTFDWLTDWLRQVYAAMRRALFPPPHSNISASWRQTNTHCFTSRARERKRPSVSLCVCMAFGHFRPLYEAMKLSDKRIHYLWQARTNRNELLFLTRKAGPNAKSQHFEFISKNVIDSIEIEQRIYCLWFIAAKHGPTANTNFGFRVFVYVCARARSFAIHSNLAETNQMGFFPPNNNNLWSALIRNLIRFASLHLAKLAPWIAWAQWDWSAR